MTNPPGVLEDTDPIKIYQYATYDETFTSLDANGDAEDLSAVSSAVMQIRENHNSSSSILSLTSSANANGSFVDLSNKATGQIRVLITDEDTKQLAGKTPIVRAVTDILLLYNDGTKQRFLMGTALIYLGASRV